jgi:hypothetical protein
MNLGTTTQRLLALSLCSILCVPTLRAATPAVATSATVAQTSRPDQVFEQGRSGVRPVSGEVVANRLDGVVISSGGRERTIDAADVVRVQLNRVPASYREGSALLEQRQPVAAAEAFLRAAEDTSASEPARAAARHLAAASLLKGTAADLDTARRAVAEAERFLTEHPDSREVPEVRLLLGRAQWLAGDPAAGAATLESLFREANGGETRGGYSLETCYRAGLLGAQAALAAGDRAKGQELFSGLESSLPAAISILEPEDPRITPLEHLRATAQLGEGHMLLAAERGSEARDFFQARLDAGEVASVRGAARLGLAQALEAEGRLREAQVLYAQVSATAADGDDLVAGALLGLARTSLAGSDPGGRARARTWLEEIRDLHGDSLSAREAHESLSGL